MQAYIKVSCLWEDSDHNQIWKNIHYSNNYVWQINNDEGWRQFMEDAHIATLLSDKKSHLFAIFDGHGGAEVAKFVEKHFTYELQSNKNYQNKNYQLALKQTFFRMDELLTSNQGKQQITKIQKLMRQQQNGPLYEQQSHAGCTANVCLITTDFIYVANAGDSRCVACNIKGETKELSHDHKPDNAEQRERIIKAGGQIEDGRINSNLNLSRSIGDLDYKTHKQLPPQRQMITALPQIIKIKNQNIDFIIMGCDGIWQVKKNEQMVKWIRLRMAQKKPLGKILQNLMDQLVSKDVNKGQTGLDNMSAILIKFVKGKK